MAEESLRKQTVNGVVWSFFERFSGKIIQFCVMLVMARLLSPSDYGVVGIVAVFISLSQTLIDSGFSQALVRKKDLTDVDISTTFYFNIVVGIVLYFVLFFLAPFIAKFYDQPIICPLMRVICLVFVFNSLAVVQRALYTAKVDFRTQAIATCASAILSGSIGIYVAYRGYGPWALVAQQVLFAFFNTVFLWFLSRWRPSLVFSWFSFFTLFNFGSKILVGGLINTIYVNLYQLTIGKLYSVDALGFYSRARHFADVPSTEVSGVLQRVTYPVLCKVQDDQDRLIKVYRHFIKVSCFVVFPIMMLLGGISKPLILMLIGEKWLFSAKLLMLICFSGMLYPIHHLNVNILQAIGRSDLTLKIECYKKVLGLTIFVLSTPFGVEGLCIGGIISSIISLYINGYYVNILLHYSLFQELKDVFLSLLFSLIVFFVVSSCSFLNFNNLLVSLFSLLLGGCTYLGLSYCFKLEELDILVNIIRGKK